MASKFIIVCLLSLFTVFAWAQDGGGSAGGAEYSGHLGVMLPNQIPGVTEMLPVWGLRYAMPMAFAMIEGGVSDVHAEGVDFRTFSVALRMDMNTVPEFTNIFYAGYDMNAYRPTFQTERIWLGGLHVGTGLMMHIASTVWLRTDLKFAVSPGTSLYLGFGFAIRPAPGQ